MIVSNECGEAIPADSNRSEPIAADPLCSDLAAAVKSIALDLGFALCRIAPADDPQFHWAYRQWLADGFHGEMEYLARQEPRRGAFEDVLPGARSVVCVALNYAAHDGHMALPPRPQSEPLFAGGPLGAPSGIVARYARYDDYHQVMWSKLNTLLDQIRAIAPGTTGKAYCDTGPITERDIAMRAGIGWIGKHTNLISRHLGNWFFLGEIILDIALPADEPSGTHCGTCTRCIAACPTEAIVAPYRLDARKCISYLTIELKGSIPEALRPAIGTRIYGCDDCLAACPWNKFARQAHDNGLTQRTDLTSPDLLPFLQLDADAFREKFRNSPIRRTKRRGLLRNVCVALGNAGDARALPALSRVVESDPEPLVREHAAWAVARLAKLVVDKR